MARRGFKPSAVDLIIIFTIFFISALSYIYISFYLFSGSAEGVIIESDGKIYAKYEFNSIFDTKLVEIKSNYGYNIVELKNRQARITDASCQDKVCVNSGWIGKPNQMLVCIPNRLVVRLVGKSEIDYISY